MNDYPQRIFISLSIFLMKEKKWKEVVENHQIFPTLETLCFSISITTYFWIIFYVQALIKTVIHQGDPLVFICYYDTHFTSTTTSISINEQIGFPITYCLYIHDIVYNIFNVFAAVYCIYATTRDQTRTLLYRAIDNFLHIYQCIESVPFRNQMIDM
jgi:hypothetical protein